MPDLDVSPALTSNMLVDDFLVLRRAQGVSGYGRAQISTAATFPTFGVVVASSPDNLDRGTDHQEMMKTIGITTQFRLRGPAPGYQPDLIQYRGVTYVVTSVGDYSAFLDGFVVATAQSINSVDVPPEP